MKINIYETCNVKPFRSVKIIPEVSGKIVFISKNFYVGKMVKKDEILVKIEKIDYETNYFKALKILKDAELNYEIVKEKAKISQKEWKLAKKEFPLRKPSKLKLYVPQLAQAKAYLEFAKKNLLLAKKNLERTVIKAPYNGIVILKNCDIGEFVPKGKIIGKIVNSDKIEVHCNVPDYDIRWIDFNDKNVKVIFNLNGEKFYYNGILSRTTKVIDFSTRTLDFIVDVINPYSYKMPLFIGSFVKVYFNGVKIENSFKLPVSAIHNQNEVWIYKKGKLFIKKVKILKRIGDNVYVKANLNIGDLIITTNLPYVSNGMKVRVNNENNN